MTRRFQFSLRALMVATTVVAATCAWVAHNAALVRRRQAMREVLQAKGDPCFREEWCMVERHEQPLPWLRQVFGDEPLRALQIPHLLVIIYRDMQVGRCDADVRVPRRVAHLSQAPPAGERMAHGRVRAKRLLAAYGTGQNKFDGAE